jgi:hypothetical protein
MRGVVMAALVLLAAAPVRAQAPVHEGLVYVVDAKFDLEEVLEEVLVRRRPQRVEKFWVVVTGDEVSRMTRATGLADPQLARAVDLVRQFGAILYVCERDLQRLGIPADGLLPWVEPLRGFDADAPRAADERFYAGEDPALFPEAEPQLRRLRAACSAGTD